MHAIGAFFAGILALFSPGVHQAAGSTSVFHVFQGGTGRSAFQANTVLLGNGANPIATTSAGTNGYVLGLLGGVPTWLSTSTILNGVTSLTASSPLSRDSATGAVTISCPTCNTSNASVSSIATTFPISGGTITTTGTIAWTGISTTSNLVQGNLLYATNNTTGIGNVATSTNGTANTIAGFDSAGRISPLYASSTGISFTGSLVGTRSGYTGALSPIHTLILSTATTTTWTASSSGAYIPSSVAPFAGVLRDISCAATSTQAFIGTAIYINQTIVSPTYFVASTTVGTIAFSANNTFNKGDTISMYNGTTTTDANAKSVSCSLRATETP